MRAAAAAGPPKRRRDALAGAPSIDLKLNPQRTNDTDHRLRLQGRRLRGLTSAGDSASLAPAPMIDRGAT
jgi:hypothetical protein